MATDLNSWLKLKSGSEVRGREERLTDERVTRIGYAWACLLAERLGMTTDQLKIAVGRDSRPSGARILSALTRGITAADSDVLDCGFCAAPALFSGVLGPGGRAHGAVMVTASHPDPALNGFKFVTARGGLCEADVAELLRRAAEAEVPDRLVFPTDATGLYARQLRRAAARLLEDDALKPLLGMRVIVDGRGGAGGFFARFLSELGADTEGSLGLVPGEGSAWLDLASADALVPLREAVLAHRADLGVAFSADCEQAAIVDGSGRAVTGNRMIALMSAILLEKSPGATIVTDSVTSSGLSAFIAEWGGEHYRYRRGYRNVIDEAARLNAEGIDCPLAMETSGHCAFRENSFLNDGMYLALRIVCEALDRKREGQDVFALIDDLAEPVEAVELRLPILEFEDWTPEEEAQEVVEGILSYTLEHPEWRLAPDNREGVRIVFNLDDGVNNAWFQLRKSVHDPVLALNAESDVPGGVKRILAQLLDRIGDTKLLDLGPLRRAVADSPNANC